MKQPIFRKTAALLCIFSMLLTAGLAGCKNNSSDSSKGEDASVSKAESSLITASNDESKQASQTSKRSTEKPSSASKPKTESQASDEDASGSSAQTTEISTEESTDQPTETPSQPSSETPSQQPAEISQDSAPLAEGFTYQTNADGTVTLTSYTDRNSVLEIPSTIGGKQVTSVGDGCFQGNVTVEKVTIPEGVLDIGEYAFECCSALKEVRLPETLKAIGAGAFSGCDGLSDIRLTDSIESIGNGAFLFCRSVTEVNMPKNLRELGRFAFAHCSGLRSVSWNGDNIRSLPDRLFYSCTKLTEFHMPYALTSIGQRTFGACEALTSVTVPGEIQTIGEYAFHNCDELKKVNYRVISLSDTAYKGCYQLPEGEEQNQPDYTEYHSDYSEDDSQEEDISGSAGSIAGDRNLFDEQKYSAYRTVSNDEFSAWSKRYISFCRESGVPIERDQLLYTMMYKGEVIPYYLAMTSAQNQDPSMTEQAAEAFGEDYREMYLMIDHGLTTELKRGKMCDDLVLYSGVYDSQLMAAAGTDAVPTMEQLRDAIGNTFTDPIMISTTTDIGVACNFSRTLFIIYASKEKLSAQGAISIDSIINTNEKEILMADNAKYRVLDVGTIDVEKKDSSDAEDVLRRNYVKVELL